LPYACEAPYSQTAQDFFGPTRVVGRLPDVTGGKDAAYLVGLLRTAANYTQASATDYLTYFGISAEIWKQSTAKSLAILFGNSKTLKTIPNSSAKWSAAALGAKTHFINCHGAQLWPQFFGQPESKASEYPVALD